LTFRHPGAITGTHAYIADQGYMDGEVPGNPGMRMPNWFAIGTPGHEDEAHKPVSQQTLDDLVIPPRFVALWCRSCNRAPSWLRPMRRYSGNERWRDADGDRFRSSG
jgi:hypothetical protein